MFGHPDTGDRVERLVIDRAVLRADGIHLSVLNDGPDPVTIAQVVVDDALARKAYELTALAKTEFEKIRAIAQYAQNIQYISIQTGVGRGGGYRPHASNEVFAKAYGDCKDKANLMRAMLKVVGIDSIPVSIYSGDANYVRAAWPSPQQFNHCIIAVKVSDETQAGTIIKHPRLGRLLIFDPTDEQTPIGDLPYHMQGSLALIDSKTETDLVRMPVTPPEMNQLERFATLELQPDGAIAGQIKEQANGQTAARFRTQYRQLSKPEYTGMIERWLTTGATSARLNKMEPTDHSADGRFGLNVEFSAPPVFFRDFFCNFCKERKTLDFNRASQKSKADRLSEVDSLECSFCWRNGVVEGLDLIRQEGKVLHNRATYGLLQNDILDILISQESQGRLHILKPADGAPVTSADDPAQLMEAHLDRVSLRPETSRNFQRQNR